MTGADKITPFSFVKAITETKENLYSGNEKEYNPFLINRALSFNVDCLFIVQEINKYGFLSKESQHDYLLNSIEKKRRSGKWIKKDSLPDDILLIKSVYGYSDIKAEAALKVISDKDLLELRKMNNKGGRTK